MATSLKPIARPQGLADQVYETLRKHLREGLLRAGDRLTEIDLATRLEVSRTPVREALARLASEGLVDSEGRGYSVPTFGERDADEIYEVRFLLEPAAIRQVVESGPSAGLHALRKALSEAEQSQRARDDAAFVAANARFRDAWLELVPNRRLVRAIELYDAHVRYLRTTTLGTETVRAVVLRGMHQLLEALEAGRADAAADAIRAILGEAKHYFRESAGFMAKRAINA
ncbi:MAG: GntR family transcriptional regulator [Burkholderiaceae bacterium]|nr:GntR family transcriptional regulator [Burkholderiaceae bacterium]